MQSPRKPAPFVNAGMPMNNKYKILLVEDEPSIRKYVNALLNASGYIVIEAANCAEAKPCFLSHTPDLVRFVAACGKHYYGHGRTAAYELKQLHSVPVGQPEVKKNKVGRV